MELVQLCRPGRNAQPSSTHAFARARGDGDAQLSQAMSASELMYFFGAPLAHIVEYQDRLRSTRCEKSFRAAARSRRACDFAAQLAVAASTPAARGPGCADAA